MVRIIAVRPISWRVGLQGGDQSCFAADTVYIAPSGDHLHEPSPIARVRTEDVVLGKEAAVAIESDRAATVFACVAPYTFVARQLIGGIDNLSELHRSEFYPRCSAGRGESLGFHLQGCDDTFRHGLQRGR